MRINTTDLVEDIAARAGSSVSQAKIFLDTFEEAITDHLKAGNVVHWQGVVQISVQHRQGRKGVNPRSGQEITIPALNTVKYRAGERVKAAVKK